MSNIYLEVGNKIRFYRKINKFTQEELGEILDIDQSYLGRIERGEINITLETLTKIAEALHIKPFKLLEYSEKDSDIKKNEVLNKIDFSLSTLNVLELTNLHSILEEIMNFKNLKS
ncbi:helix-turn-helix domain-containing protein [Paenibacillus kyungheensis]